MTFPYLALKDAHAFVEKARPVIFGNIHAEIDFLPEMKVCHLHGQWQNCAYRADRIARRLRRQAAHLSEQFKAAPKRSSERASLKAAATQLEEVAQALTVIVENVFIEAQERLARRLDKLVQQAGADPDDFHDEYFQTIAQRPGIEWCWEMSLEEVGRDLLGLPRPGANAGLQQLEFAFPSSA